MTDGTTGITDTTTRYVLVSRDDVAPIVTLENDTFYADDNGNYTITGITEPGATIEVGGSSTEADENGEFSFTSTLPNNLTSMLVTVTATDAAGNSGTGSALITTIPDGTGDPVTQSPLTRTLAVRPPIRQLSPTLRTALFPYPRPVLPEARRSPLPLSRMTDTW